MTLFGVLYLGLTLATLSMTRLLPEGEWLIMTFRKLMDEKGPSRPQRGIDYLDKEAVAAFIKITHEEYEQAKESFFESGLTLGWMQEA